MIYQGKPLFFLSLETIFSFSWKWKYTICIFGVWLLLGIITVLWCFDNYLFYEENNQNIPSEMPFLAKEENRNPSCCWLIIPFVIYMEKLILTLNTCWQILFSLMYNSPMKLILLFKNCAHFIYFFPNTKVFRL